MIKLIKIPNGINIQYGKPWLVNPYLNDKHTWLINFYESYDNPKYIRHIYNITLSNDKNSKPRVLCKLFNHLIVKV